MIFELRQILDFTRPHNLLISFGIFSL